MVKTKWVVWVVLASTWLWARVPIRAGEGVSLDNMHDQVHVAVSRAIRDVYAKQVDLDAPEMRRKVELVRDTVIRPIDDLPEALRQQWYADRYARGAVSFIENSPGVLMLDVEQLERERDRYVAMVRESIRTTVDEGIDEVWVDALCRKYYGYIEKSREWIHNELGSKRILIRAEDIPEAIKGMADSLSAEYRGEIQMVDPKQSHDLVWNRIAGRHCGLYTKEVVNAACADWYAKGGQIAYNVMFVAHGIRVLQEPEDIVEQRLRKAIKLMCEGDIVVLDRFFPQKLHMAVMSLQSAVVGEGEPMGAVLSKLEGNNSDEFIQLEY